MSRRLEVLIPAAVEATLRRAARRARLSKGEWVRRAIRLALRQDSGRATGDAVDRLVAIEAPTSDIREMLEEIGKGRGA